MGDQQGTGKHPHKSAAEPEEHHEAPTTKGSGQSKASQNGKTESNSGEQGTGKHPHKSAAEPEEHHEAPTAKGSGKSGESHAPAKAESHAPAKAESHAPAKAESGSSDQGTGKHPHKKASDPHEHHEGAKANR